MEKREMLADARVVPDLRGYMVFDSNDFEVGSVDKMVFTDELNALKYLEVNLNVFEEEGGESRHVLVPVGMAFIKNGSIYLKDIEKEVLWSCPDFSGHELTDEYEEALLECLVPQPGKIARNPDEYFHYEHFFNP